MSIDVLFTFDYELFLGSRSGTVEACLVRPGQELLSLLERTGVRSTLFLDILYYFRLLNEAAREPSLQVDVRNVRNNLISFLRAGHDVELHLHPHWLDAVYSDGQWNFPHHRRYRLHNLSISEKADDPESIQGCVATGCRLLRELCEPYRAGYNVTAFRAGGWCVEPFKDIRAALLKNNVTVDSSVAPGFVGMAGTEKIDFSAHPRSDGWRFQESPSKADAEGAFKEIPITTFTNSVANKLPRFLSRTLFDRASHRPWGDGKGLASMSKTPTDVTMMSIEGLSAKELISGTKQAVERGHKRVTLIGHPKNFSPYSIRELEKFIHFLSAEGARFCTVAEAAQKV